VLEDGIIKIYNPIAIFRDKMVYIEMIKWELVYKILLSIFIWIPLTIGTSIYFTKIIKTKKTEILSRRRTIVN